MSGFTVESNLNLWALAGEGGRAIKKAINLLSHDHHENWFAFYDRGLLFSDGCNIQNPDMECMLEWELVWEDPHARGDRNGGFAYFQNSVHPSIALLGQGGV